MKCCSVLFCGPNDSILHKTTPQTCHPSHTRKSPTSHPKLLQISPFFRPPPPPCSHGLPRPQCIVRSATQQSPFFVTALSAGLPEHHSGPEADGRLLDWKTCSDFPSEAKLWIERVEMVGSLDALNPRDQFVERIFQTSRCWTRRFSALNKIIRSSQFEEVSVEEQKSQKKKKGPVSQKQIAFITYTYFRVTGGHDIVLDYVDFSITLRDDSVRYKMGRSSVVYVKKSI